MESKITSITHKQFPQTSIKKTPEGTPELKIEDRLETGTQQDPPLINAQTLKEVTLGISDKKLPRKMTPSEKIEYKEIFPNLKVDETVVTAEETPAYNCISWSAGVTNQWCWPPYMYPNLSEEAAFDKFYGEHDLKPVPAGQTGEVARWRNDDGITHGCVSGPDHGPNWESKCGAGLRIEHELNELVSDIYGWPDAYYTRGENPPTPPPATKVHVPDNVKEEVSKMASEVDPKVKEKFDGSYTKWLEFRKNPKLAVHSDPREYCKTKAFDDIVKLGAKAVPLLMDKIAQGDFFSLQAVSDIKKKDTLNRAPLGKPLTPEETATSEQNRSAQVLLNWFNQ